MLAGGVGNAGAVVRAGDEVLRPAGPHALAIHSLLAHLAGKGFDGVPRVLGVGPEGRERLRFIPGEVPIPPFPTWAQRDPVLASTARLLRRYHDAVLDFEAPAEATWSDELADPTPGPSPIVCHNDVCPENVVHRDGEAVALLDFEFAAPGRPVWDVAALARMCVPIDTDDDAARTGRRGLDPFARLAVVADAYGLDPGERVALLDALAVQVAQGGEFVRRRVESGEPAFVEMWEHMGGQARYDRRREWFASQRPRFESALGI